jgi:hypothetical protein
MLKRLLLMLEKYPMYFMDTNYNKLLAAKVGIIGYSIQMSTICDNLSDLGADGSYEKIDDAVIFPAVKWLERCLEEKPKDVELNRLAGLFALRIGNTI